MERQMLVKVCGMRHPENIREVEACGVDMMGFIFHPSAPRYAGTVPPSYMPRVPAVGVFVDADAASILSVAAEWGLWGVQLHGGESPQLCAEIRSAGYRVLKAFGVGVSLPANLSDYFECCDMFVFDTATSLHGGSGRSFDWSKLSAYSGPVPFLLSGGISPASVAALQAFSHPDCIGIDINSGFETAPGLKSASQIRDFLTILKDAHQ